MSTNTDTQPLSTPLYVGVEYNAFKNGSMYKFVSRMLDVMSVSVDYHSFTFTLNDKVKKTIPLYMLRYAHENKLLFPKAKMFDDIPIVYKDAKILRDCFSSDNPANDACVSALRVDELFFLFRWYKLLCKLKDNVIVWKFVPTILAVEKFNDLMYFSSDKFFDILNTSFVDSLFLVREYKYNTSNSQDYLNTSTTATYLGLVCENKFDERRVSGVVKVMLKGRCSKISSRKKISTLFTYPKSN